MEKLFDVVVWETQWTYSLTSDTEIPSREKAYWGTDGKLVASFNSIRTAIRVCRELKKSIEMSDPQPVDIGGGQTYTPRRPATVALRNSSISFGVVINDRDYIF